MENCSVIGDDGRRIDKKVVVMNVGPLSRFDDGKPDYFARLKQSFDDGAPIIPELLPLFNGKKDNEVNIKLHKDIDSEAFIDFKAIGYFILESIYFFLGISDVMRHYKSILNIQYDLDGITQILIYGRVLCPDSKLGTFEGRGRYAFEVTHADDLNDVYKALDVIDESAIAIQNRINHKISLAWGRSVETCFYDVTNFWFEISQNDSDVVDERGNIIPGFRKKGVSKEHRSEPIVQMGLFTDENNLPIAYRLFPGNTNDQSTLRPVLEQANAMKLGRIIFVADGGVNGGPNIVSLLNSGNGYIVAKSTRKSDQKVVKWILDEEGYKYNDTNTFKVKSMIRTRIINSGDGNSLQIEEKIVSYWSKKQYIRALIENSNFIKYLDTVISNPNKLKDKAKKIEQFLIEKHIMKSTGEIIDTKKLFSVNWAKVNKYTELAGYYTIITSEIHKSDEEIINKYHGLSRIEDSFRITKSDLEGRPVFVRTPEHINAHFLICFVSLVMYRIIQYKILKFQGKDTKNINGWEAGLSASRISEALNSWLVEKFPKGVFRVTKPDEDLALILSSFGVKGDLRLPNFHDLKNIRKNILMNCSKIFEQ
jgi:transposase